jgi:hypothetical protein
MAKKQDAAALRAEATKCRIVARRLNDSDAASNMFVLAAKLEQQARDIEQKKK